MKTIYLAAGYAKLQEPGVIYNDLIVPRENRQDMLDADLSNYDILIATPPCNFYSYARGAKAPSEYALKTAHLLLEILVKFYYTGKPFIIENVTNKKSLDFIWSLTSELNLYRFKHARHTYITNLKFNINSVPKEFDFCKGGYFINAFSDRQGGNQVSAILDLFIKAARSEIATKSNLQNQALKAEQQGIAARSRRAEQTVRAEYFIKIAREELNNRLNEYKKLAN